MYDFVSAQDLPKPELYRDLAGVVKALVEGEPDAIANMANMAAAIWQFLPDQNWAGFYRVLPNSGRDSSDGELVLGPFIGKPACIRIPFGQGVCGTAAALGKTQIVPDVLAFSGHIACDAASRSELVVPIIRDGRVIAVIDLDSPTPGRFDDEDATGVQRLAQIAALAI